LVFKNVRFRVSQKVQKQESLAELALIFSVIDSIPTNDCFIISLQIRREIILFIALYITQLFRGVEEEVKRIRTECRSGK